MKFSLIVPVFNAARHLSECLNSLLSQTICDWECICIDDGSTDESLSILRKYETPDQRFRVIQLERNSGVAAARNTGLNCASGEYIGFVDADDMIAPIWLEVAADAISATGTDMVKMRVSRTGIANKYIKPSTYEINTGYGVFDLSVLRGGLTVQNFYRHDILTNVRFPSGMKVYEDGIFNLYALLNVTSAVDCQYDGYLYRNSETSAFKGRNTDDIIRLSHELVTWYLAAKNKLDYSAATSLAKQRIVQYINAVMTDFFRNANLRTIASESGKLSSALREMEQSMGISLVSGISGRLGSAKRLAYNRFLEDGSGLSYGIIAKLIALLKGGKQ